MVCEIVWLKRAQFKLKNIVLCLKSEWSETVSNEFLKRLNRKVLLISENPNIGESTSKRKNVRKYIIAKQITLYYKIERNRIIILTLFDNRQDPSKLMY